MFLRSIVRYSLRKMRLPRKFVPCRPDCEKGSSQGASAGICAPVEMPDPLNLRISRVRNLHGLTFSFVAALLRGVGFLEFANFQSQLASEWASDQLAK